MFDPRTRLRPSPAVPSSTTQAERENPGFLPGLSSARFAVDQIGPRGSHYADMCAACGALGKEAAWASGKPLRIFSTGEARRMPHAGNNVSDLRVELLFIKIWPGVYPDFYPATASHVSDFNRGHGHKAPCEQAGAVDDRCDPPCENVGGDLGRDWLVPRRLSVAEVKAILTCDFFSPAVHPCAP
jgi:hypothetical protein